jgi:hypothetical protein
MSSTGQVPIPGPKGVPFLGNVYDIEPELPLQSFERMADSYGMDRGPRDQGCILRMAELIHVCVFTFQAQSIA